MMDSISDFYAAAAELFTPGGPGRVDWYMTDSEIVEMLRVTNPGYEKTGALFVIATPADVVAIKPVPRVEALAPDRGALERDVARLARRQRSPLDLDVELRDGRHDCGYARDGLIRTPARGARRTGVSRAGDAIVRAQL